MKPTAWHKLYNHPLPEKHKFPMAKYDLLKERLLSEGILSAEDFIIPEILEEGHILECHTAEYLAKLESQELEKREARKMGFPQSSRLIEREKRIMDGTLKVAELSLEHGLGFNIAGGTHHAYSDRPEGFCLLNDLAIAAKYLHRKHKRNVLIIDLDVHQGNGTAEILGDDANIFTFSMHGENNYPLHKEESDLDIGLDDGTEGNEYLDKLEKALHHLKSIHTNQLMPDGNGFGAILYQCGADVLSTDKFGRLGLTLDDTANRDRAVYTFAKELGLPVAATMGGGYSKEIEVIVEAHLNTFRIAIDIIHNGSKS